MYRRILVPVDGSAASTAGLRHALGLAAGGRARVRLLNVVDNTIAAPLMMQPEVIAQHRYVIRSMRDVGAKALKAAAALAAKRRVHAETSQVDSGGRPASDLIVPAARSWGADLIVMGTHGRRGWNKLMLGSDAERVLRDTPVPLLLVRAGDAKQPAPRRQRRSR